MSGTDRNRYYLIFTGMTMGRLIVCSTCDVSSVNIRDCLFRMKRWEDIGTDGKNTVRASGEDTMITIPELHIYAESVDDEARRFGVKFDDVVFLSRHKAASGVPTLTVHPIGNYNAADFGGAAETLVKSSPELMTDALRIISARDTPGFEVSFEVTHHGPFVDTPSMFIEIGSDETMWPNMRAAEILAHAVLTSKKNDHPNVIGVGGGHYAPRFTEIADTHEVNFGHMLPNYAFKDHDEDGMMRMVRMAAESTDTRLIYIHRKSMKRSEESRLSDMISSYGYETVSSKDLEPVRPVR
jgi:D-aminoacyl-tRNA deacylase